MQAGVARMGRAAAAAAAAELGLEFPRRAGRLLTRMGRGELELKAHHEGLERVTREFEGMTNRLALAMILTASVVAPAVALGVNGASSCVDGEVAPLSLVGGALRHRVREITAPRPCIVLGC